MSEAAILIVVLAFLLGYFVDDIIDRLERWWDLIATFLRKVWR